MKIALLKSVTHIISVRKIMSGDLSVSLWEVKIHIKGSISFAKDGLEIDNVKFHLDKDGVLAKIVVESTPEDMGNEAIKYVNRILDKIAFETGASIRIEKNGMKAKPVSVPIANSTGEVLQEMVFFTIKLRRPAIDEDTLIEAAKWGSNLIHNDDYKYFQKSLSHYRNGLNAESDGNLNAFLDFWNSIEVIAGHYGEGRCLFSWDNVTESDSEKLIRYLIDEFEIKWVKNAEIIKLDNDDGKIIRIFKDENSVEIRIDKKEKKAILTTSDFRHYDLIVKKENGELNIYGNKTKDKICDCFEKCFGERKENKVNELNKVRTIAAHGKENVSDPAIIKTLIEKTPQIKKLASDFLEAWSRQKAQNFEFLS